MGLSVFLGFCNGISVGMNRRRRKPSHCILVAGGWCACRFGPFLVVVRGIRVSPSDCARRRAAGGESDHCFLSEYGVQRAVCELKSVVRGGAQSI